MTLQSISFEFPYIVRKFDLLFYQCMLRYNAMAMTLSETMY
jgi:hypothetical protein